MKNFFTAVVFIFLTINPAFAEVEENYCFNKDMASNNEDLARQNPQDPILIKLVALRSGLCELVKKGIIETEFAIELFDAEKSKGVLKRLEEDVVNKKDVDA